MKLGKYIIEVVPKEAKYFWLILPYDNYICYSMTTNCPKWQENCEKKCKHIKPNTGIRYLILGKYWIFLMIKQLN